MFVPLVAGLLWGYARKFPEIAEAYELCGMLYIKEPIEDALARIENPDLIAFSSYVWNHQWNKELARAIKKKWPNCTTIAGGVQIPEANPRALTENPEFDYCIWGEGEGAFADFLREHASIEPDYKKVGSLTWRAPKLVDECIVINPRRAEIPLEDIPSPYLDGLFDDLMKDSRWSWNFLAESNRGCPYASFVGDTYVALPDRILRFDEQEYSKEKTLSCPDRSHRHRLGASDERLVAQGKRKCLKLSFSNGLSLSVTTAHPMFRVRDEKIVDVRACDLKVGDWVPIEVGQNSIRACVKLAAPSKTKAEILSAQGIGQGRRVPNAVRLPKLLSKKVAWLAGYLIGDGCLPSDNRAEVLFAVTDKVRSTLVALTSELFGLPFKITDSSVTKEMQHGQINSRKVVQFFRESLGIEPCEDKLKVPRGLFQSPKAVVREFLDGLWCADGYQADKGEPYLTTVSLRLAVECAALIHWIGDAAVVRKLRQRSNLKNAKPFYYRVEWHGVRCRERIEGQPCVASHVPAIRHTYTNRDGVRMLRHTVRSDRRQHSSPRVVLRGFEPNHPLLDRRFVYVQITRSKLIGTKETYDIHNHPDHTVAANGVYVRQCTFCAWGAATLSKLRQFPMDRIIAEFEWMGQNRGSMFYSCDANLGILKRDVEMIDALVKVKERHGFPEKVRGSFAKNSNDVVFDISKKLSDAGMLKATTLALQSMSSETLDLIKRKNIKYEKLAELTARYEAAGIATYTEIIVGLPGETLQSYVAGLDALLESGQHDAISIYLCVLLESTEMATPEYRLAHGIESAHMKALLYHGTPEPGVVEEIQETVVATATMPREDLRRAVLYGWLIQGLHSFGLTQHLARQLYARGVAYREFYMPLLDWLLERPGTVGGRELTYLVDAWDSAVRCESWRLVDARFGEVSWPPEELLFLRLACESEQFYEELEQFFAERHMLGGVDLVAQQRVMFIPPAAKHEEEYAREAVWFGRKGSSRKLRLKPVIESPQ